MRGAARKPVQRTHLFPSCEMPRPQWNERAHAAPARRRRSRACLGVLCIVCWQLNGRARGLMLPDLRTLPERRARRVQSYRSSQGPDGRVSRGEARSDEGSLLQRTLSRSYAYLLVERQSFLASQSSYRRRQPTNNIPATSEAKYCYPHATARGQTCVHNSSSNSRSQGSALPGQNARAPREEPL